MIKEMNAREFLERRAADAAMTLLDVPRTTTVVICRSGGRSLEAARFLAGQGFDSVFNLAGGILAWS